MKHTILKENTFDLSLDRRGFYSLYIREGEEFTTDDYKLLLSHIQNSFEGKKAPFLVELGYGCTFAEGVLETLTTNSNRFSTADALVIRTYAHKLTVQFYIQHFEPPTPTDVFDTEDEAFEWLQPYLNS